MTKAASITRQGNNLSSEDIIEAALDGKNEVVDKLLRDGVDVNTCDSEGFTVLHIACMQGNEKLVDIVFGCGQSVAVDLKNRQGFSPWQMAAKYGHMDLALKARGPQHQKGQVVEFSAPKFV